MAPYPEDVADDPAGVVQEKTEAMKKLVLLQLTLEALVMQYVLEPALRREGLDLNDNMLQSMETVQKRSETAYDYYVTAMRAHTKTDESLYGYLKKNPGG